MQGDDPKPPKKDGDAKPVQAKKPAPAKPDPEKPKPKTEAKSATPKAKADAKPDQPKPNPENPKPKPAAKPDQPKPKAAAQKPATTKKPAEKKPAAPKNAPPEETKPVRPPARPAKMRRRHWGLVLSFFLFVAAPLVALGVYLWTVAEDQYASVSGFTVRQDEGGGASQLLGGLAQLTGSSVSTDGDILYEFILSQELLRKVEKKANIRAHYSERWSRDPLFSIWPDASIEDLEWFWKRIVEISLDQGSGLMELRVVAFTPEKAQQIAKIILEESQKMINALNTQAREDAMRYARADLKQALARLKKSREALTAFRSRTRIVDPAEDIRGRMGVMNQLQQQLAEALVEHDLLLQTASPNDPRLTSAKRRIDVIRARIRGERETFAKGDKDSGAVGENYPDLIAEFEGLVVDREFAEQTYRAALAAVDLARTKASRQSRYLATYIEPTLAETSEHPRRLMLLGLAALFLLLSWSIVALIYYSIRDRS